MCAGAQKRESYLYYDAYSPFRVLAMHQFLLWKGPLLTAQSIDEVQRLMGDYLGTLRSRQIEALPPSSWDALTVTDIRGSALILIREGLLYSGKPESAGILHEVTQMYIAASDRIAAIQRRGETVREFRRSAHG